jgi:hypothetical protein
MQTIVVGHYLNDFDITELDQGQDRLQETFNIWEELLIQVLGELCSKVEDGLECQNIAVVQVLDQQIDDLVLVV